MNAKIGVIGAGAWGTALASVLAQLHDEVPLWALEEDVVNSINHTHQNKIYLPDINLATNITATQNFADMESCDALLLVTPAQHLRATLEKLSNSNAALLLCSKGIEAGTQKLMSDIASDICPNNRIAVLSGPTFAHEVAAGKPTAITLATEDEDAGRELMQFVATPQFRPYWTDDVVGAEIGGAVKNVLAIGCGVVDGAGLGLNARAALIARGFAEMQRYGVARGGRIDTLAGMSGLGDLVLTCSSENSRNFALGRGLGQGDSAKDLMANRVTVAEGAYTAPVLQKSARALNVEMPIVDAVCSLISGDMNVSQVIRALLSRPLKAER